MQTNLDQQLSAASLALSIGNLAKAEQICSQVLFEDPNNLQAKTIWGRLAAMHGNSTLAISVLEEAIAVEPETDTLILLAAEHRKTGNLARALELNVKAAELSPDNPFAWNALGLTQTEMMLLPEAAQSFSNAAELRPDVGQLQHNLGKALIMQDLVQEALPHFEKAAQLDPGSALNFITLSRNYFLLGRWEDSAMAARKAIEREPQSPASYVGLAYALSRLGNPAEALDSMKRAVELDPNDFNSHNVLGKFYQSVGMIEEAESSHRKSISMEPMQGFGYFAIAHNKRVAEEDRPLLLQMEALSKANNLPPSEVEFLEYGLAKAYESLGDYEQAMAHYDEANRIAYQIKFGDTEFDKGAYAASIDQTVSVFSEERMKSLPSFGSASEKPILVVGMMRSGTTLVEQILSAHPEVAPGGELDYWVSIPNRGVNNDIEKLRPEEYKQIAIEYLQVLDRIGPNASRVTDKMPQNFFWAGFILHIFPNARIIHTKRNGADICISNYATANKVAVPYAHSKENIAFVYEQYLKLAEHWRKVLPADRYLEVDYEELALNGEPVSRQIVSFCGLEWDDRCLKPGDSANFVVTPSAWQVRQPLYSSSIGRWKNYEPWLGPFAKFV